MKVSERFEVQTCGILSFDDHSRRRFNSLDNTPSKLGPSVLPRLQNLSIMAPVSIPAPIVRLSSSEDIISFISSTQTVSHDAVSGKPLYVSPAVTGPQVEKDLKSKLVKLVATGYAPYGKPLGGEQSVEPVVAVITEDKIVRLIQAETGKVFYER